MVPPGLTLCSLASGSTGNCTYVATARTRVLVDAGISTRRIEQHLRELDLDPARIDGVCITHEHGDHVQALPTLQQRYQIPLYATAGTIQSLARKEKFRDLKWRVFTSGQTFEIGDLRFDPFSIPHDAFDPVGFTVTAHGYRVGFATDIGLATNLVRTRLQGCHVLILETNHDRLLLEDSDRPWPLKQRISGRQGHLSNEEACELLRAVAGPELRRVYLAHLSQDCNLWSLAESSVRLTLRDLGREDVEIFPTHPGRISEVWCAEQPLEMMPL